MLQLSDGAAPPAHPQGIINKGSGLMPQEISFENIPAGYSLSASKAGEAGTVQVSVCEFTSSEDGDLFIKRLEGFPAEIVSKLPVAIKPSQVDHLLAIIRRDKTATIYVNELKQIAKVMVKRAVNKGEAVFDDDIGDVDSLHFEGINIPKDASVLFLFSVGWRKGLFYDFWPTQIQESKIRDYDLDSLLGQLYTYLMFQDFFKISETEWKSLMAQGWFPFATLKKSTIKNILNYNKNQWNVDGLLPQIRDELLDKFATKMVAWNGNKYIKAHAKFIEAAIERYIGKDYISSISILFPRIEGLMRSFHQDVNNDIKINQSNLVESVIPKEICEQKPHSLLLPQRFRQFLTDVYFANFDPKGDIPLSRHSVSHGVADDSQFSLKGATQGFLALDQLSYYLK